MRLFIHTVSGLSD